MTFVNLTPHAVTVIGDDGTVIADIPPSGVVARIAESATPSGMGDGIPLTEVTLGDIEGLGEPARDVNYIVSRALAMGAMGAPGGIIGDLWYPFGQVFDKESGRIIGCRSLARVARPVRGGA